MKLCFNRGDIYNTIVSMKKNIVRLMPALMLLFIISVETINLYVHKPRTELTQIKTSISSIVKQRWSTFLFPQNSIDSKLYSFSQQLQKDIPKGSKILYIKDTHDGTDLRRYFILNYLLDNSTDATYNFEDNPDGGKRQLLMKETNSQYSVSYEVLYGGNNAAIRVNGKLYSLDTSGNLYIKKEYAL